MEWTIGHYILFISMIVGLLYWIGLVAFIFLKPKKATQSTQEKTSEDVIYPQDPILDLPQGIVLSTDKTVNKK